MPGRKAARHFWAIDFVRFAAALLVAVFHLTWMEASVSGIAWYGWIGVQIFFVISGLVIARSANDTTPIWFVESRVLRLYPGAWTCAVIGLGVAGLVHHQEPDLLQRFVASFLLSPVGPFLASAYWTLPIELAFYALICLVLLGGLFERLERVAVWLCGASALYNAAYALQRAGLIAGPDLEFGYDWKNVTLLRHGIYFAVGVFIWLWSERRLSLIGWLAFGLAIAVAPLEITCRTAELLALSPAHLTLAWTWPVPVLLWLGSLGVIMGSAKWEGRLGCPPAGFLAVARAAGLATYPLYLLHEQFGEAMRNLLRKVGMPYLASVAVAVLASVVLAAIVSQVAEPALRRTMRGWFSSFGQAAEGVPWLRRLLFRPGGTV